MLEGRSHQRFFRRVGGIGDEVDAPLPAIDPTEASVREVFVEHDHVAGVGREGPDHGRIRCSALAMRAGHDPQRP